MVGKLKQPQILVSTLTLSTTDYLVLFEWFNAKSTDLLLNVPQAWATGISTLWTNYGSIRNCGIELTLGWQEQKGDFSYSISGNLSTLRNEVLKNGRCLCTRWMYKNRGRSFYF